MLILNPDRVRFDGQTWPDVLSLVVDRAATKLVEARTDQGPHTNFADVAEQRVTIRIAQVLGTSDMLSPLPGDAALLEWWTSPNASQAQRVRVQCDAVVTDVGHELGPLLAARRGKGSASALRTITLIATSSDGKVDPLSTIVANVGPD